MMAFIKKLFVFSFLCLANIDCIANPNIKPYSEIGVFGGTAYYLGELNRVHFPLKLMQPAGGIFYRYTYNGHYAFRAFINYNEIKGYDDYSKNAFENERKLSFKSPIIEVGGQLEFNFYEFALDKTLKRKITPFVFGGLNYFYFNPQARNNSGFIDLQPLQTEGKHYSLHQIAIPIGVGFKMKMGRFGLTAEWGIRQTFTDYIDDVSTVYVDPSTQSADAQAMANKTGIPTQKIIGKQRGDSTSKDYYVFTGFTLSYRLSKEEICRVF
jgi:hypothetical protein